MKIRAGFVSNSSAASFIVNAPAQRIATTTVVTERLDEIDRIRNMIDLTFSPYMRARSIIVQADGMKPFTNLYSFLNKVNISDQIVPCSTIKISNVVGEFQSVIDSAVNTNNLTERTTSIATYDIISRGDVITTSTGSAVVIAKWDQYNRSLDLDETVLKVTNIKGTISAAQTVTSKVKGGTATVVSVTTETDTVTNSIGSFAGIWRVPASTFETKLCQFVMSDVEDSGDRISSSSYAETPYRASGTVKIYQDIVTLEKNANISVESTVEYGTVPVRRWVYW